MSTAPYLKTVSILIIYTSSADALVTKRISGRGLLSLSTVFVRVSPRTIFRAALEKRKYTTVTRFKGGLHEGLDFALPKKK